MCIYTYKNHQSKHGCEPNTPPHQNNTTWQWPPSRTTCPDTPQTLLRNSSRSTIKGPRCWPSLQIAQIPIWKSICTTCWSRSDPRRPHPPPCLDRLELFWLHKGNLHNIRQVVMMLCLIGVLLLHVYLCGLLYLCVFELRYCSVWGIFFSLPGPVNQMYKTRMTCLQFFFTILTTLGPLLKVFPSYANVTVLPMEN